MSIETPQEGFLAGVSTFLDNFNPGVMFCELLLQFH